MYIGIYHLDLIYASVVIASGIFIAASLRYLLTKRMLGSLETKGEYKLLSQWKVMGLVVATVIGVIVFAIILSGYIPRYPPESWYFALIFLSPMPATFFATYVIAFKRWEKRNHKRILWEKQKILAIPN